MKLKISDQIERDDALSHPGEEAERYSEWHHFTFNDDRCGLYGIFNLALSGDVRDQERGRAGVSLVVCEGRRSWRGTMNLYAADETSFASGALALAVGGNSVAFREGRYVVAGALKDRSIVLEATWTPRASALRVENIGGLINTFILPRLTVEGVLSIDGREHRLEATGYHDHNWGHWSWGRDLGWDWGYILEPEAQGGTAAVSIVFGQVTDAARAAARSDLVLLVWIGERCEQIFLDDAVEIAVAGELSGVDVPRVPGLLAMLDPGRPQIPRRLFIRAAEGEDRLEISFEVESALQFLIPHPSAVGNTRISELVGRYQVRGILGGRPVDFSYTGFAEIAG